MAKLDQAHKQTGTSFTIRDGCPTEAIPGLREAWDWNSSESKWTVNIPEKRSVLASWRLRAVWGRKDDLLSIMNLARNEYIQKYVDQNT
jgi:hypothetical protein